MAMHIEPSIELSLLHFTPWRIMKTSEELSLPKSCLSKTVVLKDSPLVISSVNYKERSENAETISHALNIKAQRYNFLLRAIYMAFFNMKMSVVFDVS